MKIKTMTNLIDGYLLKSGMPPEELCIIHKTKRAFYYYGMLTVGVLGLALAITGIINILS